MCNRQSLERMALALRARELSPLELVDAHLAEIRRRNPTLNAFVETYPEEARARAKTQLSGPLAGIPVTLKDSFDLQGRVTHCGSLLRRGARAAENSTAAQRLLDAGAIILGKTSTPEFLYNYETDNHLIGPTTHPLNPALTPGGSSGGEAAAIAAFCSAGGIGSDGGGSIRQPAHLCGLCGLKPTPGRVPAFGHYPEIAHPTGFMGVGGPMARTVRDTEILFEVLAGHDPRDPFSVPIPIRPQPSEAIRLLVLDQIPVAPPCQDALRLAESLHHPLEPFPFALIDGAHELWRLLFVDLITSSLRAATAGSEHLLHWTGTQLMDYAHEEITTPRLAEILLARDRMRSRLLHFLGPRSVILAPVFGVTAFPHRRRDFELMDAVRPLTPWNLLGLPALVVPISTSPDGLPAGVQLIAAPYCEELLLDLGKRLEEARGDSCLTPSLTTTTSTT